MSSQCLAQEEKEAQASAGALRRGCPARGRHVRGGQGRDERLSRQRLSNGWGVSRFAE